jgi:protein TilB
MAHFYSIEKKRDEFQHELTSHTPESRLKIARDLEIMRNGPKKAPKEAKKPIPLYGKDGRILQRNEGKWEFHIIEQDDLIILTVETSKFLDSSLLEVEVHADWVKVTIKGKVLQLRLECLVVENEAVCERSRSSGQLVVTMLKATSKGKDIDKLIQERKQTNAQTTKNCFNDLMKQKKELPAIRDRRQERFLDSLANLEIKEVHQKPIERVEEPFEDDPNVPPLE